jgi:hypothetical protein
MVASFHLNPFKRGRKAQGMVEFALAMPVLLMIILGIFEMGRLLFIIISLQSASREATRYGSAVGVIPGGIPPYANCAEILAAAIRVGSMGGVKAENISIYYDHGQNNTTFSNSCPPPEPVVLGDRIHVQIQENYQPIVPLPLIPSFPIRAHSVRTIMKGVDLEEGYSGSPYPTNLPTESPTNPITPTPTATP